jgi:hypothetical protein
MFKNFCIFLIISLLGCLAAPMNSYACGTKPNNTEKSCCLKEKSEKSKKEVCCGKYKITGEKDDNSCGGNCDNSTCNCPSTFVVVLANFLEKFGTKIFITSEKVKSFYNQTYHSSGFGYIWTPPNIG